MSECIIHHYACNCREAKLAEEIAKLRREKEEAQSQRDSNHAAFCNMRDDRDQLLSQLAQRDATIKAIRDAWDDLLEDLELHGMHGFEPYARSKAKYLALLDREQT